MSICKLCTIFPIWNSEISPLFRVLSLIFAISGLIVCSYTNLDDSIFAQISASRDSELAGARALLDRLKRRQLYKLVDEILIPIDKVAAVKQKLNANALVSCAAELTVDDFVLDPMAINFCECLARLTLR
jgi:hypothetical protein